MESAFFTRKQLAEYLGCGEGRAVSLAKKFGLRPIDFGSGRGGGLRWLKESVMEALHTMAREDTPRKPGRKSARHHTIAGKSASDLFAEFEHSRMPIQ